MRKNSKILTILVYGAIVIIATALLAVISSPVLFPLLFPIGDTETIYDIQIPESNVKIYYNYGGALGKDYIEIDIDGDEVHYRKVNHNYSVDMVTIKDSSLFVSLRNPATGEQEDILLNLPAK